MNYSEVKELLQAGFTADEIRVMLTIPADNPQNPQNNPQPEQPQPKEAQENEVLNPDPVQDPAEKAQENDAKFNQLNDTMEKLIRTIQHSNLNNNSFDHMKETDINTEVDKIMAGIIRPEREQKEV